MKKILLVLLIFSPLILLGANRDPIILFHGFMGWGRAEMKGYRYWGGSFDLEDSLRQQGFEVYTVSMGPISSNWDRAIEAFYQIKGGQVDYGSAHSEKYNLIRKPESKQYPGLYPQWDADHPIHIFAHSMGGLTARMLEYLLKTEFPDEESSLLTESHDGWIKSITTLSTPHNGTTLAPIIEDFFPFLQKIAPVFGGLTEDSFIEGLYDFDLEQWGLERREDEKLRGYFKRLKASPLKDSHNTCIWDLSIDGAREFNSLYHTDPEVYYFSFATSATRRQKHSPKQIPDSAMTWNLWSSGFALGRSSLMDSTWYENDGIVNTISMEAPYTGDHGPEPKKNWGGTPQIGVWQFMGKMHYDHHKLVGHDHKKNDEEIIRKFYNDHFTLLYELD